MVEEAAEEKSVSDTVGETDAVDNIKNLETERTKAILDNKGENLFEIMLECTDSTVREAIGNLFKYLLCKLKV